MGDGTHRTEVLLSIGNVDADRFFPGFEAITSLAFDGIIADAARGKVDDADHDFTIARQRHVRAELAVFRDEIARPVDGIDDEDEFLRFPFARILTFFRQKTIVREGFRQGFAQNLVRAFVREGDGGIVAFDLDGKVGRVDAHDVFGGKADRREHRV